MIIKIAIDVMGGDGAPHVPLKACENFLKKHPDHKVFFNLFGKKELIEVGLKKLSRLKKNSTIFDCSEVIDNNVKPSVALRQFKDSSMKRAITSIKDGESDCLISAGNTGALMSISAMLLKNIAGIARPAIISAFPTLQKSVLILDLGANLDCSEKNLVDFAILGSAYFHSLNNTHKKPRLALLNIGTEENKGSKSVKDASQIIKNALSDEIDFQGYVEPGKIWQGGLDVVVTDGFNGNIFLKTSIALANLYNQQLKKVFNSSLKTKIGASLIKKKLKQTLKKFDTNSANNGGPFLGINGIVLKTHGDSDEKIFANTIETACTITQNKLLNEINKSIEIFSQNYEKYAKKN